MIFVGVGEERHSLLKKLIGIAKQMKAEPSLLSRGSAAVSRKPVAMQPTLLVSWEICNNLLNTNIILTKHKYHIF